MDGDARWLGRWPWAWLRQLAVTAQFMINVWLSAQRLASALAPIVSPTTGTSTGLVSSDYLFLIIVANNITIQHTTHYKNIPNQKSYIYMPNAHFSVGHLLVNAVFYRNV